MGKGYSLNGVHSRSFGIVMLSKNRQALAESSDSYLEVPSREGAYLISGRQKDKELEVLNQLKFTSIPEVKETLRFIAAWQRTDEKVQLIFDDEPDKYELAKLNGALNPSQKGRLVEFTSSFRCDPHAYNLNLTTQAITFPSTTINLPCTSDVLPVFSVTFTNSSATSFKIVNGDGKYVLVNRWFFNGEVLVIDCEKRAVSLNGIRIMTEVDLSSRFFSIYTGGDPITPILGGAGTAEVSLTYRGRWY